MTIMIRLNRIPNEILSKKDMVFIRLANRGKRTVVKIIH